MNRMRRTRPVCQLYHLLPGLLILGGLSASATAAPTFQIVSQGKSKPIYVVDPDGQLMRAADPPGPRATATAQGRETIVIGKDSVEDLRFYLGKLSGAEFQVTVIPAYPEKPEAAIYVGRAADLKFNGVDRAKQQYGLRTTPEGQLLIAGGDDRGVSHGIYALLGDLGCRWFMPGELWTVLPEAKGTLEIAVDRIGGPDFFDQRSVWPGSGVQTPTTRKELQSWERRNGMAQPFAMRVSHSWIGLDPQKDFEPHPEWFALVEGKRQPSKPCYSHPEVIAKAKQYALDHFDKNPEAEMVSVSAPDGLGFCTCDLCKAQARVKELKPGGPGILAGVLFGENDQGQNVSIASETIFNMANQVAKAVAAKYPGKRVGVMAYSAYAHPPSFGFEPNVYVEITNGFRRTPLSLDEQVKAIGQKSINPGVYEYYDVEQWSWEHPGKAKAAKLDEMQKTTRFFYDAGVRSISGEMSNNFGPNGIGYYVLSRLLWNSKQEARQIEQEFYRDLFGPAADPIRHMYHRWEGNKTQPTTATVTSELGAERQPGTDPASLALAYQDLAEADKLIAGRQPYQDRVNRLKMYVHFLKLWIQPPTRYDPVHPSSLDWAKAHESPAQRQRVEELGRWTHRLVDTHLVHWAYSRYLVSGATAMGLDTSTWEVFPVKMVVRSAFDLPPTTLGQSGSIPTAQEIDDIFKKDLAELERAKTE